MALKIEVSPEKAAAIQKAFTPNSSPPVIFFGEDGDAALNDLYKKLIGFGIYPMVIDLNSASGHAYTLGYLKFGNNEYRGLPWDHFVDACGKRGIDITQFSEPT